MNNFIRYYNQNRRLIWRIVVIIIAIWIFLRFLNYLSINNNKKKISSNNNVTNNSTLNNQYTTNDSTYTSNNSAVSGSSVNKKILNETQSLLDVFYGYCNKKDLASAYDMLTDECKELIYPSLNIFEKNYYNNVFKGYTKAYSFENWYNDTYYVKISDNALATGKVDNIDVKYDYVTINNNKLNISSYLGRTNLNKESTQHNVNIMVNYKDVFMDYEIYNVTVKNSTGNTISLTDISDSSAINLMDSNNIKYGIYNHELVSGELIVENNYKRKFNLKFYSSYVSSKRIKSIEFNKIKLNYGTDNNDYVTIMMSL